MTLKMLAHGMEGLVCVKEANVLLLCISIKCNKAVSECYHSM